MTRRVCFIALLVAGLAATVSSAQATYISEVLDSNPFVYLQMNETKVGHVTEAANSGSSGVTEYYCHAGGISGSFSDTTLSAKTGFGKTFNRDSEASGASIYVPDQGASYSAIPAFTFEFLLKPKDYSGLKAIYAKNGYDAGTVHLNLNSGDLELAVAGNAASSVSLSSALPVGSAAHIAVTYAEADGTGTTKFYANGALLGSSVGAANGAASFSGDGCIGCWVNADVAGRYFDGALDEFAIYGSALSASTILSHATAAGFASVPEPSTLAILVSAVAGLLCYAWQKRK
jgi:hypothetical protein